MNGLLLLLLLVAVGMGAGSVVYQWKAPAAVKEMKAARAALPADAEARVEKWIEFGRGLIHNRMVQLRQSSARPWLVTHVVEVSEDPAGHEIWGVDLAGVGVDAVHAEGKVVVVVLPAARLLGHGRLTGDMARDVPHYRPGEPVLDPDARAEYIVEWAVERLSEALAKDIDGATLEVRAGRGTEGEVRDPGGS